MNDYQDEVSLRDLYLILKRGFWLIAGVAVLAGVGAFVFSSLQPDTFEAEATVLVTPTPERRVDDAGATIIRRTNVDYLTYSSLAFTERVLESTMTEAGIPADEADRFRERLELTNLAGDNTSSTQLLLSHAATAEGAAEAAELANIWSRHTIQAVQDTMRGILEPIVTNNSSTVGTFAAELQALEDSWRDFQNRDDTALLQAELNSFTARNAAASERLDSLARDLAANRAQQDALAQALAQVEDAPAAQLDAEADSVMALLESRQLLSPSAANELKGLMQGAGTDAQLVRLLLGLELQSLVGQAAALEANRLATLEQLDEYAAAAAQRRTAIAQLAQEGTELERELRIAETLYTNSLDLEPTLSYVSDMLSSNVRLLDPAAPPLRPSSGSRLLVTVIALVVGGLLATVFVFLRAAVMPEPDGAAGPSPAGAPSVPGVPSGRPRQDPRGVGVHAAQSERAAGIAGQAHSPHSTHSSGSARASD